jgi:hypothetical protein
MHKEVYPMISLLLAATVLDLAQAKPLEELRLVLQHQENRQVFRVGEKIRLTAGYANQSDRSVWLDGRIVYRSHLTLSVADSQGREVQFPGSDVKIKLAPPRKEDFVSLRCGISLIDSDITDSDLMLESPGTYTINLAGSHGASERYAEVFGLRLGRIGQPVSITIRVTR